MTPFARYKFFSVFVYERVPGRKTKSYAIVTHKGATLGLIKWYGPWRQFVLEAYDCTVWSGGCLAEVLDALEKIKAYYQAERSKG